MKIVFAWVEKVIDFESRDKAIKFFEKHRHDPDKFFVMFHPADGKYYAEPFKHDDMTEEEYNDRLNKFYSMYIGHTCDGGYSLTVRSKYKEYCTGW